MEVDMVEKWKREDSFATQNRLSQERGDEVRTNRMILLLWIVLCLVWSVWCLILCVYVYVSLSLYVCCCFILYSLV